MCVQELAATFDKCILYAYIREVNTTSAQILPKAQYSLTDVLGGLVSGWSLELPYSFLVVWAKTKDFFNKELQKSEIY